MEHVIVWEARYGPVPEGFELHHRDKDKLHNVIENLECLTALDHKRSDSPNYRLVGPGEWERCCNVCREWKPATAEHFYITKQGWIGHGRCRPCHISRVVERRTALRKVRGGD